MKVIAYTALMYGKAFFDAAIRSVIDEVDEFWVLYSAHGSHGSYTDVPCPDSRDDLFVIALNAAGQKLRWVDGNWKQEGEQRDYIHVAAPDADIILVVDSDEVYADGLARDAIAFARQGRYRRIRLPFLHLWRSFYRGFAHDPAYPERVICMSAPEGTTETFQTPKRIWHFGYAQDSRIVGYKMAIHGHRGQWRTDVNWFADVFMANRQVDCHPVGSEFWDAEDIDQANLPTVLLDHPYRRMGLIP